jgi:lipoprotein-anchoring transpeptidase ErfK/SrfK
MKRFEGVSFPIARTAVASLAVLIAAENLAGAGSNRNEGSIESVATRTAGEPIMAIVSLHSQRITV